MVGGFVVTDRMLEMFGRGRRPPPRGEPTDDAQPPVGETR
jgi:hypothetical protein